MRILGIMLLLTGCATIRAGEVGVKQTFGHLDEEVREPGLVAFSPIGTRILRVPTRTTNLEVKLALPSREGLNVTASVSILYHVQPELAPKLLQEVGVGYESQLVLPVFRSAAADVSARYAAKDMHSGERAGIEDAVRKRMTEVLGERGIVIESVLMKSITLPPGLYAAVEEKLAAEQQAQRMKFILDRERQEAQRRRIEAEGIRDAQRILEEGLTETVLAWRSLEAFEALATSENAKIIVTDGKTPLIMDTQTDSVD